MYCWGGQGRGWREGAGLIRAMGGIGDAAAGGWDRGGRRAASPVRFVWQSSARLAQRRAASCGAPPPRCPLCSALICIHARSPRPAASRCAPKHPAWPQCTRSRAPAAARRFTQDPDRRPNPQEFNQAPQRPAAAHQQQVHHAFLKQPPVGRVVVRRRRLLPVAVKVGRLDLDDRKLRQLLKHAGAARLQRGVEEVDDAVARGQVAGDDARRVLGAADVRLGRGPARRRMGGVSGLVWRGVAWGATCSRSNSTWAKQQHRFLLCSCKPDGRRLATCQAPCAATRPLRPVRCRPRGRPARPAAGAKRPHAHAPLPTPGPPRP